MPFRLLGLVADPDRVGDIFGRAFAHYAALGTEITLVCAAGHDANVAQLKTSVRALGVHDVVLLDFRADELSANDLEAVFADIMTCVQPHVVVADSADSGINEAAARAFTRVHQTVGGSAALPAKLYVRIPGSAPSIGVTSAVPIGDGAAPELFARVLPEPWLTGVLERDLFAGIPVRPRLADLEQLAS